MNKKFSILPWLVILFFIPDTYSQNTFPATGNVGIGTTSPTQLLTVNGGNIQTTGAVYASNWFRSFGTSGWYNETYAGGWYMSDPTWIRAYNSKNVYTDKVMRADGGFDVGGNTVIDAGGGWHRSYGATGWFNQTYGGGWFMSDPTWIRAYNSKSVYTDQVMRADGGFNVGDNTVIDAGGGWHRSYGDAGWYNQTYGGGIYMSDPTWVRVYNNKLFYSSNTIRTDGELQAGPNGNRLLVTGAGNVRIGNVNMPAGYKLFVEQGILTEKVKVAVKTTADWSDHVFNEKYLLMPVQQLEQYIKTNRRLPGIPPASEMVKNGNDLGQTDAKLLEKIEELTLYLLQQQQQIETLKKEIQQLKK